MKFRFILTGIFLGLLSIAAFAADGPQTMSISCKSPNPDPQSGLHRIKGDSDMWTFAISLEGGARFVKGPYWSYPGKGGNDPDWGMWTDGKDGDSSLGWSSPQKTGSFGVSVNGQIVCGDGNGGEPINFSAGWDGEITDYHLAISIDKTAICAGGVDSIVHQATITATLTDDDNEPVGGKNINFTLDDTNGEYPQYPFSLSDASMTTNEQGKAVIILTSSRVIGNTVKVKATYKELNKETDEVTAGKPNGIFFADPETWWADGVSIYDIIFGLLFNDDPVNGHQLSWTISKFELNPQHIITNPSLDYGEIIQSDNETRHDGKADAIYRSSWYSGTVTFTITDNTALSEQ